MGISIEQYRAKIGSFMQPDKSSRHMMGIRVNSRCVSMTLRLLLLLCTLLVVSGSVESNPGPITGPCTRQQKLSQADTGQMEINKSSNCTNEDIMKTILSMQTQLQSQISSMNDNFKRIDDKVTNMATGVTRDLSLLRKENTSLRKQVNSLEEQLDDVQSRSRRNNLLFHGLEGERGETWDESENKIRTFMKDRLGLTNADSMLITRAHRLAPHKKQSPIIANFVITKDRNDVLRKAKDTFHRQTDQQRVSEDLTRQVRDDRRALSATFKKAQDAGENPKMRHNKLIVGHKVYQRDRVNNTVVCVSDRTPQTVTPDADQQADLEGGGATGDTRDPVFLFTSGSDGRLGRESTLFPQSAPTSSKSD